MRFIKQRLLVAAIISLAFTATVDARPTSNTNRTAGTECSTVHYHNYLLHSWLRFSHHGADYHASTPSREHLQDLASIRACWKRNDPAKYRLVRGAWEKRRATWAFYRYIDQITTFGTWAVPSYIVQRESRYERCAANPSSTAGGYYQMLDSTWLHALAAIHYHGQTHFGRYPGDSHIAACAPDWLQHEAAHELWRSSGSSPWRLTR